MWFPVIKVYTWICFVFWLLVAHTSKIVCHFLTWRLSTFYVLSVVKRYFCNAFHMCQDGDSCVTFIVQAYFAMLVTPEPYFFLIPSTDYIFQPLIYISFLEFDHGIFSRQETCDNSIQQKQRTVLHFWFYPSLVNWNSCHLTVYFYLESICMH